MRQNQFRLALEYNICIEHLIVDKRQGVENLIVKYFNTLVVR